MNVGRVFGRNKERDRVKRFPVTQIAHTGDLLGESPVWCPDRQELFWVDILGLKVHTYTPATSTTRTVSTDVQVGCIAITKGTHSTFAAGTYEGVGFLDSDTGAFTKVVDPERHKPANRFNDGKVDPQGRFIVGSMYTQRPKKIGSANLYRWSGGKTIERVEAVGDVTTSNGLGWTKEGDKFYYIDSPTMRIMEYTYDAETGVQGPGRVAVSMSDTVLGAPDGLSVDEEGNIWVAVFRAGKVVRYDPSTSEVLAIIELPCVHVTSCCFGGLNMDRLFITTAKGSTMEEVQVNNNRTAGALFAADVGVRGVTISEFKPDAEKKGMPPSKL
eukprot:TRINITY_DN20575_c0_g2_i1.p1 TRINITY_DN20575_c0_g2~~TRINITY_DN20575_c0_g2_i1.p1  ORF type:complete len:329 (+),score=109.14 TRINITY_DN20575_c0_g2_i1:72-1058(+)